MKQTTLYINYSLMVLFTVYTVIKNTKPLMITWKLHAQQFMSLICQRNTLSHKERKWLIENVEYEFIFGT